MNPARSDELGAILRGEPWITEVLDRARDVQLPDWFVGAGAIRDLVWDVRFGHGFDPANIEDIDLVYFDVSDLSKAREHDIEDALGPGWDVTNQAAVHIWFHEKFGGDRVEPVTSTEAGIATWPEFATCVGVRLEQGGALTVAAPHGLDDLLDGIWRTNDARVTAVGAERRFAKKDVGNRWPSVRRV